MSVSVHVEAKWMTYSIPPSATPWNLNCRNMSQTCFEGQLVAIIKYPLLRKYQLTFLPSPRESGNENPVLLFSKVYLLLSLVAAKLKQACEFLTQAAYQQHVFQTFIYNFNLVPGEFYDYCLAGGVGNNYLKGFISFIWYHVVSMGM